MLNDNALNLMLDALGDVAVYVSLHTSDPGASGANEVTGGSYARKQITWASARDGSMDATEGVEFDVPAGTTVRYVGLWSASSSGTFLGSDDVTAESFAAQGVYTLTGFTINGS